MDIEELPYSPSITISTTWLYKPVLIRKKAWISAKAALCPGITVGEGAVVAAGAAVVPHTLAGGNPAKYIKDI